MCPVCAAVSGAERTGKELFRAFCRYVSARKTAVRTFFRLINIADDRELSSLKSTRYRKKPFFSRLGRKDRYFPPSESAFFPFCPIPIRRKNSSFCFFAPGKHDQKSLCLLSLQNWLFADECFFAFFLRDGLDFLFRL